MTQLLLTTVPRNLLLLNLFLSRNAKSRFCFVDLACRNPAVASETVLSATQLHSPLYESVLNFVLRLSLTACQQFYEWTIKNQRLARSDSSATMPEQSINIMYSVQTNHETTANGHIHSLCRSVVKSHDRAEATLSIISRPNEGRIIHHAEQSNGVCVFADCLRIDLQQD